MQVSSGTTVLKNEYSTYEFNMDFACIMEMCTCHMVVVLDDKNGENIIQNLDVQKPSAIMIS